MTYNSIITNLHDPTNTPHEIIDLVNHQDQVIGQTTKGQANADPGLIHREVGIILYDQAGQHTLIQQRSLSKNVSPGLWTVAAAGHIPSGTSPDQAAHLELQEELGFDTPLTFVEKKLVHKSNETHFTYWYLGRYTNQPITLEPAEVQQTMLATRAQIHQLIDQHQLSPSSATMIPKHWPSTVTRSLNHEIK